MKRFLLTAVLVISVGAYWLLNHHDEEGPSVILPTTPGDAAQSSAGTTSSTNPSATTAHLPSGTTQKDGTYTGSAEDNFYGLVQVSATISGGQITDIKFLQYPTDRQTSAEINAQATPALRREAIQAQSANVDIVSGATQTSLAFQRSLKNALQQAQ